MPVLEAIFAKNLKLKYVAEFPLEVVGRSRE